MHDPTEGGLATGLQEISLAAGIGLRIDQQAIPVLPECAVMCDALGVDPLGLIASGALLLTCAPDVADRVLSAWAAAGVGGNVIGHVTPPEGGCRLTSRSGTMPLPRFPRDEVARLLDGGLSNRRLTA